MRQEALDKLIIVNRDHLHHVMLEYIEYYNTQRPHQGISQKTPLPFPSRYDGQIHCEPVLGGIIHSYYRKAG